MPITKLIQPFVLSHKTSKGDDWVEEEGMNKTVNFQCFNNEETTYNLYKITEK